MRILISQRHSVSITGKKICAVVRPKGRDRQSVPFRLSACWPRLCRNAYAAFHQLVGIHRPLLAPTVSRYSTPISRSQQLLELTQAFCSLWRWFIDIVLNNLRSDVREAGRRQRIKIWSPAMHAFFRLFRFCMPRHEQRRQ
jgi:hypothetical protein